MSTKTPQRLEPDGREPRPTPKQWGYVAQALGELTPDTIGVVRP